MGIFDQMISGSPFLNKIQSYFASPSMLGARPPQAPNAPLAPAPTPPAPQPRQKSGNNGGFDIVAKIMQMFGGGA